MSVIDQEVRQAITLARQGDKAQAQELLKQALKRDPDNVDAWVVLAQVVENRDEAITYMKRAVNLQPDDERARRYLDYLLQQQDKPVEKPGPSNGLIIGLAAVAVLLCVGFVLAYAFLRPGAQQEQTTKAADCQALIEQALLLSDQGCQNIGSNEVCYGHSAIQAELASGSTGQFDKTGDVVKLDMLSKFIASPLDLEKKEWGIGVFKVEANVPGSLPGQAVTLLIFGSSVDNDSGDMRAFYFSSGLGSIVCDNVPFDGILVRMPDGTGVTFRANGADITMMGTGVMQAQEGDKMTVSMLTGTGKVSSDGQEQVFGPGQQVGVPLDGLEADGPPSYPGSAITDTLTIACTLTGVGCPGVTIPTISQADIAATQGVTPGGPTAAPLPTSTPRPDGAIVHVVQSGDTLFGVALMYGVDVNQIRQLNASSIGAGDLIGVGQELVISLPAAQPTAVPPTAAPTEASVAGANPQPAGAAAGTSICVQAYHDRNGDTFRDAASEELLPNAEFAVAGANGVIARHTTDGINEPYCFAVAPGAYRVIQTSPAGYEASGQAEQTVAVAEGAILSLQFGDVRGEGAETTPEAAIPTVSASEGDTGTSGGSSVGRILTAVAKVSGILVLLLAVGMVVLFVLNRRKA